MLEIDASALSARLQAGEAILLVDVREPWEHALAALPGSVLVPLGELEQRVASVVPTQPGTLVVAYCHHGMRSLSAAAMLEAAGVREVASLRGGIDAWSCTVDPSVPRY